LRHLTVLFCDLVGSTEIAAQLDPEEWREVVAGYHRAAAEAITRFGGHVAKYLGDGVMAYFGWPEAHDNDAERAARAGLALLDAIAKLGGQAGRLKLAARVGIDSGAVVVGVGVGKEADVFGETPNIAARLQATAQPSSVLITAATHRLISGLFVVEALGPRALKGITSSVEVFQDDGGYDRQPVCGEFVGHPIGKVILVRIPRKVIERQDSDRSDGLNVGGWRFSNRSANRHPSDHAVDDRGHEQHADSCR
jgi:class 3 adenylate cyclase